MKPTGFTEGSTAAAEHVIYNVMDYYKVISRLSVIQIRVSSQQGTYISLRLGWCLTGHGRVHHVG